MKIKMKILIWGMRIYLRFLSIISVKLAARVAFRIFSNPIRKSRIIKPEIFYKSEPVSLIVSEVRINGFKWVQNKNKKALIVHGFESRAYNFEKYVQPLIDLGYDVYAMDAKAHGGSEGKTIVLPEYIEMIHSLEKEFGRFDVYMGHSFGGLALSLFIERYPNPKAKLVLIAPATETSTAIDMFCQFLKLHSKVKSKIHQLIEDRAGVPVGYYSIRRAMPQIDCKVLWIHDLHDDITPFSDAKPVFEAKQQNVTFLTTLELGHRKIYRDSEVMHQIFGFLNL